MEFLFFVWTCGHRSFKYHTEIVWEEWATEKQFKFVSQSVIEDRNYVRFCNCNWEQEQKLSQNREKD